MQNKNSSYSPGKLDEAVKSTLVNLVDTYSEEDWLKIQPQIPSASSSLFSLGGIDLQELAIAKFAEHKRNILYIAAALVLVVVVLSISSRDHSLKESSTDENDNNTHEFNKVPVVKTDSVRGVDTLKTVTSNAYYPKEETPLDTIKSSISQQQELSVKNTTTRDSTNEKIDSNKLTKKKKQEEVSTIEEIRVSPPKPTTNITKKKRPGDSVETKAVVDPTNMPQSKENSTVDVVKEEEKKVEELNQSKRKIKRNRKESIKSFCW